MPTWKASSDLITTNRFGKCSNHMEPALWTDNDAPSRGNGKNVLKAVGARRLESFPTQSIGDTPGIIFWKDSALWIRPSGRNACLTCLLTFP